MKALLLAALTFATIGSQAMAAGHNYQCIADSLQAINSDIYYNLSPAEIDSMLSIPEQVGHIDAVNAAKRCDPIALTQKQYQCIADSLQAYNSSIYCNLSNDEVDAMLNDATSYGHDSAVEMAKYCGAL